MKKEILLGGGFLALALVAAAAIDATRPKSSQDPTYVSYAGSPSVAQPIKVSDPSYISSTEAAKPTSKQTRMITSASPTQHSSPAPGVVVGTDTYGGYTPAPPSASSGNSAGSPAQAPAASTSRPRSVGSRGQSQGGQDAGDDAEMDDFGPDGPPPDGGPGGPGGGGPGGPPPDLGIG